ncbi:MAG: pseudouridine synthase [Pirellulales bacterium]
MPPKKKTTSSNSPSAVRLHKLLADSGIASRRKCEEMILNGQVEVDGIFVTKLGIKVDPDTQKILVNGQGVKVRRKVYYLLNKPINVLSTNYDQAGRLKVFDILPQNERIFTVGRLDKSSEGLMLVTNDGEMANRLAHPRYGVQKTYHIEVAGHPSEDAIKSIGKGIHLAEAFVKPVSCRMKRKNPKSTVLEIVLDEGKNREIRRILAKIGHKVLKLKRIALGPLRLGEVPTGAYRELKFSEVNALKTLTEAPIAARKKPVRRSTSSTSSTSRSAPGSAPKKKAKRKVADSTKAGVRGGRSSQRGATKKASNKKLPKKNKQKRR